MKTDYFPFPVFSHEERSSQPCATKTAISNAVVYGVFKVCLMQRRKKINFSSSFLEWMRHAFDGRRLDESCRPRTVVILQSFKFRTRCLGAYTKMYYAGCVLHDCVK